MSKLFMTLIGCTPAGRNIEQHDVFFGIGDSLKDIVPAVNQFWPIKDILSADLKQQFSIWVEKTNEPVPEDELHLGYFKLEAILSS